jgi:cellulose synthase/poly-beta-1,6-N-acetylglucosamine synthase-like glycosyltransferase
MGSYIKAQNWKHFAFYTAFGLTSLFIFVYYLSNTVVHYTSSQQFPINSFIKYPLTGLIFIAELFSFCFALYFLYNLYTDKYRPPTPKPLMPRPAVAFCIPVYNEPYDVVDRTLIACRKVQWPHKTLYLLDDSKGEKEMRDMHELAKKHGAVLVRRQDRVGYKAGNINNGLAKAVKEDYFVILDSDQAPLPDFLLKTMDHFTDPDVFFVQTPQYYINDDTPIRRAAKIGTNIFYQTQCISKARDGAMPFCGTNVVVRTSMFQELRGFSYYTSTEDIELGLRANARGWHGVYVPEVLATGYAPPDWRAYQSQQYRWANGNLAILRESWPKLLWGKYSLLHQIHTFFTVAWWFIGITTLLYIVVPIVSLLTKQPTHHLWLSNFMIGLLYVNVIMGVMMIFVALRSRTEDDEVTLFDAFLQYSLIVNSFILYSRAAINAMFKRYIGFVRTDKAGSKVGLWDVKWNLFVGAACFAVGLFALYHVAIASTVQQIRTYLPISLWLLFYSIIMASSILFVNDQPRRKAA